MNKNEDTSHEEEVKDDAQKENSGNHHKANGFYGIPNIDILSTSHIFRQTIHFEGDYIKKLDDLKLKNVRTTLLNGRNQIVRVKDVKDVIEWVYIVRNNLFHGNKLDSEERDKVIICFGNEIMREITSQIIKT